MGYARAGFEVVGVDIKPQPHYPFEFHQADAMAFPLEGFDAIHASPPCQRYSSATIVNGTRENHPDLVGPVRERLIATGLPYIIENVKGAPLHGVELCGVALGLRLGKYVLRRHRIFESNVVLLIPPCACERGDGVTLGVYGGGTSTKERNPNTKGGRPYKGTTAERIAIMDMPWCKTAHEVNEAIPPAYTELLGEQLIAAIWRAA